TSHYSHIPLSSLSKQPATTEIYTLSLHDALPIYEAERGEECGDEDRLVERVHDRAAAADPREEDADDRGEDRDAAERERIERQPDRKSTRLNSSHVAISYAVFCLKKKKKREVWAT